MNEQMPEKMSEFLRRAEIQERIRQRILHTRHQVTAPIGVAVGLTGLSENQLRKWEEKGLLNPQREGKHRYYSPQDLDKLVLISELIEAKFPLSSIPSDIDMLWRAITASDMQLSQLELPELSRPATSLSDTASHQHIDQRIKGARPNLFWYYYASHALRLSLQLIRKDIPVIENAGIGLILPLQGDTTIVNAVKHVDKLPLLGESLVGWLALSGSSHTMLTPAPSFSNPNLYRLYQLRAVKEGIYVEKDEAAQALLVTNWKFDNLTLDRTVATIIRRLCTPLHQNAQNVRASFSPGWRDVLDPATNLDDEYADFILNGLADMAVRLQTTYIRRQSGCFCYILVPGDNLLPLQRRSLVVRAQSTNAPNKVGSTFATPGETLSIGLRAYQSSQVIYRPEVYEEDIPLVLDELKNSASTIVLPVEGVNDTPSALLYLVADEPYAFNTDDQRVLRLIGRMVQEVLSTYKARHQASEQLTNAITYPDVIDTFFKQKGILTEDQFVQDIEILLKDLQTKLLADKKGAGKNIASLTESNASTQTALSSTDVLSLIAIEIDDQARLARRYGDQFAQNLCKAVGSRLQIQLRRILADSITYNLYYSCSGGFYLLLNKLPLQEARKYADNIRRHLYHDYEVSILHSANEKIAISDPESKQLVHISVHIAVNSYTYKKLGVLLERYPIANPAEKVRVLIGRDMDTALSKGRIEGVNVVISWDPEPHKRYIRWSPDPSA